MKVVVRVLKTTRLLAAWHRQRTKTGSVNADSLQLGYACFFPRLTLVRKPVICNAGFRVRDGLGWGLVRKDDFSLGRSFFFLHAEPRRRSESCCMVFWMAALVAAIGRLGRVSATGRVAGVGGGAR